MTSFWERVAQSAVNELIRKALKKIFRKPEPPEAPPPPDSDIPREPKSHPWRICPRGEHWVRDHPLTVPSSRKGPEYKTPRHGFCRKVPTEKKGPPKEFYSAFEFWEIADRHFGELAKDRTAMPVPYNFNKDHGNDYDLSIAGWTKFWNETLQPDELLNPDLLKALLYAETKFEELEDGDSKGGKVRGLLQITEDTRVILGDQKGELKNHFIQVSAEEIRDPEVNIATAVRWLHYKRLLLQRRIKDKNVTWEDAVAEYKGIYNELSKPGKQHATAKRIMRDFHNDYEGLLKMRADYK